MRGPLIGVLAILIVCAPLARAQTREMITAPIAAPPDVAAVPKDAEHSYTGLASKVIKPGTGTKHPGVYATVTVDYTGWTREGKMFTTTFIRPKPDQFSLGDVIKGWSEGIQLMVVGETRRLWIPGALAYNGVPNMPQGMLVFDVELIAFN
jgi:FKBP-type peptidyl-prolyl cis-trans isomerase